MALSVQMLLRCFAKTGTSQLMTSLGTTSLLYFIDYLLCRFLSYRFLNFKLVTNHKFTEQALNANFLLPKYHYKKMTSIFIEVPIMKCSSIFTYVNIILAYIPP